MSHPTLRTKTRFNQFQVQFMKGFDKVIPHLFFFTVFTTVIFTIFIFINNKSKPSKEAAVRAFLVGDYIQAHNNWFNLAKERDDKAQMMLGMSEYMGLSGFKDLDEMEKVEEEEEEGDDNDGDEEGKDLQCTEQLL